MFISLIMTHNFSLWGYQDYMNGGSGKKGDNNPVWNPVFDNRVLDFRLNRCLQSVDLPGVGSGTPRG